MQYFQEHLQVETKSQFSDSISQILSLILCVSLSLLGNSFYD